MFSAGLNENKNITVIYHNYIKNIFEEIDEVITKCNESIAVDNNSINATQDQTEKSNVSLVVAPNTDDEVAPYQADGIVKNEKDENEHFVPELPSQETTINDYSDDESSPKKSKELTFTESDLPDSEETKEFLKSYPREVTDSDSMQSESEFESNSEDEHESNWCSRRRRKKTKPVTEVTIDKLPTRFITRQRVPNIRLVCKKYCLRVFQSRYLKTQENQMNEEIIRENIKRLKAHNTSMGKIIKPVTEVTIDKLPTRLITRQRVPNIRLVCKKYCLRVLQSRYLKTQENQMNEEIIRENIKRLKTHNTSMGKIYVNIVKPERKYIQSKSFSKTRTLNSIPIAKSTTKRTRCLKNETDDKNIKRSKPHNKGKKHKKNVTIEKPERMDTNSAPLAQKNNKSRTLVSISANKINTRRTRAMKNVSDCRNTRSKSVSLRNVKKDNKQKATHKKEGSTLPAVEVRRSKRYQKTKDEDMMKAPVSIPKKSWSSSSESPKCLKRSLVEDSEVQSPKRTRSQNIKVSNASTPVRIMMKTRHQEERVKYTLAQKRDRGLKRQNSNTKSLRTKTRSISALSRRPRGTPRASTKRLQP